MARKRMLLVIQKEVLLIWLSLLRFKFWPPMPSSNCGCKGKKMTGVTHSSTKSELLRLIRSPGHQGMMPPPHLTAIVNTNLFGGQNSEICGSTCVPRCLLSIYLSACQGARGSIRRLEKKQNVTLRTGNWPVSTPMQCLRLAKAFDTARLAP